MDLRVTQRFLHPGPDSAMLAPHPPFFLGHLTSQNCSQLTQQHLQVGKKNFEVGPVTLCLFCEKKQKEPISSDRCISGVTSAVGLSFCASLDGIISMFRMQN